MIDQEEIIRLVAEKHKIILEPDDPILAFLAVHDVVLDKFFELMEQQLIENEQRLEDLTRQTQEKLETAVAQYLADIQPINELLNQVQILLQDHQTKTAAALEIVRTERRHSYYAALATAVFCVLTVAGAALFLG